MKTVNRRFASESFGAFNAQDTIFLTDECKEVKKWVKIFLGDN